MAQPVYYQTLNMVGIDPTIYYTNLPTQGASVTPEYPAPPFIAGTRAFGSDSSEFIFVQASTSISIGDFVVVNAGTTTFPFSASSITTTNAQAANTVTMGSSGLVLKQSVTFIPANAYFWCCTKGNFVQALTNNGLGTNAPNVYLYTGATAGVLSSTSATAATALAGIVCINSLTTSIQTSIVPTIGTLLTTGFTNGPIVSLYNVRPVQLVSNTVAAANSTTVGW